MPGGFGLLALARGYRRREERLHRQRERSVQNEQQVMKTELARHRLERAVLLEDLHLTRRNATFNEEMLQKTISQLQGQLSCTRNELAKWKEHSSTVEASLQQRLSHMKDLEKLNSQVTHDNHMLQNQLQTLQRKLDDSEAARDALSRRVQELESELLRTQTQLREAEEARNEAARNYTNAVRVEVAREAALTAMIQMTGLRRVMLMRELTSLGATTEEDVLQHQQRQYLSTSTSTSTFTESPAKRVVLQPFPAVLARMASKRAQERETAATLLRESAATLARARKAVYWIEQVSHSIADAPVTSIIAASRAMPAETAVEGEVPASPPSRSDDDNEDDFSSPSTTSSLSSRSPSPSLNKKLMDPTNLHQTMSWLSARLEATTAAFVSALSRVCEEVEASRRGEQKAVTLAVTAGLAALTDRDELAADCTKLAANCTKIALERDASADKVRATQASAARQVAHLRSRIVAMKTLLVSQRRSTTISANKSECLQRDLQAATSRLHDEISCLQSSAHEMEMVLQTREVELQAVKAALAVETQRLSNAHAHIDTVRQELQTSKDQYASLVESGKEETAALMSNSTALREALLAKEADVHIAESNVSDLMSRMTLVAQENATLTNDLLSTKAAVQTAQQQHAAAIEELKALQAKSAAAADAALARDGALEEKVQEAQRQSAALESELLSTADKVQELQIELSELKIENNELASLREGLVTTLQENTLQTSKDRAALEKTISDLQQQHATLLCSLDKACAERDSVQSALEEAEAAIVAKELESRDAHSAARATLLEQREFMCARLDRVQRACSELEVSSATLQDQLQFYDAKLERSHEEIKAEQNKYASLEAICEALQTEAASLKSRLQLSSASEEEQTNKTHSLKRDLEKACADNVSLLSRLELLETKLSVSKALVAETQERLSQAETQSQLVTKANKEQVEAMAKEHSAAIAAAKNELLALETSTSKKISSLDATVAQLQARIAAASERHADLATEFEKYKEEHARLLASTREEGAEALSRQSAAHHEVMLRVEAELASLQLALATEQARKAAAEEEHKACAAGMESNLHRLQEELSNASRAASLHAAEKHQALEDAERLRVQLADALESVVSAQSDLETKTLECVNLQEIHAKASNSNTEWKAQYDALAAAKDELGERLETALKEQRASATSLTASAETCAALRDECNVLKVKMQTQLQDIEIHRQQLEDARIAKDCLEHTLSETKTSLEVLKSNKEAMELRLIEAQKSIVEQALAHAAKEQEDAEKLKLAQETITSVMAEVSRLAAQVETLETALHNETRASADAAQRHGEQKRNLDETIAKLLEQVDVLQARVQDLETHATSQVSQIDELSSQHEKNLVSLTEEKKKVADLQQSLVDTQKAFQTQSSESDKHNALLRQQLDSASASVAQLEKQVAELTETVTLAATTKETLLERARVVAEQHRTEVETLTYSQSTELEAARTAHAEAVRLLEQATERHSLMAKELESAQEAADAQRNEWALVLEQAKQQAVLAAEAEQKSRMRIAELESTARAVAERAASASTRAEAAHRRTQGLLDAAEDRVRQAEQGLQELQEKYTRERSNLIREHDVQIQVLEAKAAALVAANATLQTELKTVETELDTVRSTARANQQSLEEQLSRANKKLAQSIGENEATRIDLEKELSNLTTQLRVARDMHAHTSEMHSRATEALRSELQALVEEKTRVEAEHSTALLAYSVEKDSLTRAHHAAVVAVENEWRVKLETLKSDAAALRAREFEAMSLQHTEALKEARNQHAESEQRLMLLQAETLQTEALAKDKEAKLEARINELEQLGIEQDSKQNKIVSALSDRIEIMNVEKQAEAEQAARLIASLEEKVRSAEARIASVEGERDAVQTQLTEAKRMEESLRQDYAENLQRLATRLSESHTLLKTQCADLASINAELSAAKDECATLRSQLSEAQSHLVQRGSEVEDLQTNSAALQVQVLSAEERILSLTASRDQMSGALAAATAERDGINQSLQDVRAAYDTAMSQHCAEMERQQRAALELENELSQSKLDLSSLRTQHEAALMLNSETFTKQIKDLEQSLLAAQKNFSDSTANAKANMRAVTAAQITIRARDGAIAEVTARLETAMQQHAETEARLAGNIAELQQEIAKVTAQVSETESAKQKLVNELLVSQQEQAAALAAKLELDQDLQSCKALCEGLNTRVNEMMDQIDTLETSLKESEAICERQRQELHESESERANLEAEVEELRLALEEARAEFESVQSRTSAEQDEQLQRLKEGSEELIKEAQATVDHERHLSAERVREAKQAMDDMRADFEGKVERLECILEQERKQHLAATQSLQEKMNTYAVENQVLERSLATMKDAEAARAERKERDFHARIQALEERHAAERRDRDAAAARAVTSSVERVESLWENKLLAANAVALKTQEALEARVVSLKNEFAAMTAAEAELKSIFAEEQQKWSMERDRLKANAEKLEAQVNEASDELEALMQQKLDLLTQVSTMEDEAVRSKAESDRLREKISQGESALKQAESQRLDLENDVRKLKREVSVLNKKLIDMERVASQATEQLREELDATSQKLETSKTDAEDRLRSLTASVAELHAELAASRVREEEERRAKEKAEEQKVQFERWWKDRNSTASLAKELEERLAESNTAQTALAAERDNMAVTIAGLNKELLSANEKIEKLKTALKKVADQRQQQQQQQADAANQENEAPSNSSSGLSSGKAELSSGTATGSPAPTTAAKSLFGLGRLFGRQ